MPFKPGQSGNPGGRPKTRAFTDAIRIAVHEAKGDKTKLRLIAERLVDMAVDGDLQAIKEVADRLEGRPVAKMEQTVIHDDVREMTDAELLAIIAAQTGGPEPVTH